jgi:DNA (cytosine-5)-methyltransferase 1
VGLAVVELCAGGGGQALGLEAAGFTCAATIEIDPASCATLRLNRPQWQVIQADIHDINGGGFRGIDVLAGGVPCPPFSIAGKQLGRNDERDLFPEALRIIEDARPAAVMLENVPGLASPRFRSYRQRLAAKLNKIGYEVQWAILNACDYGVPQLRPRFLIVAMRGRSASRFAWPLALDQPPLAVGATLADLTASRGWPGATQWVRAAGGIAPTIVGGSRKHGGPDLGPTRARRQWANLRVDGLGIADLPPNRDFPIDGSPRLTLQMVARLQGFPDSWQFAGKKTAAYRQIGNAFPPPVAAQVGSAIAEALASSGKLANRRVEPDLFAQDDR